MPDPETYPTADNGWRLILDNDILTGQATDRDYTGGIGLTLSGTVATGNPVSLEALREFSMSGFHSLFSRDRDAASINRHHSQQFGLMLFTPEDITSTDPVLDDRPYASLLFMSNSAFDVDASKGSALVSRLTLGFLGLQLAADIQRVIHEATDSDVPSGWSNQVSAGGEPALLLEVARQDTLLVTSRQQLKTQLGIIAGSITELDAGLSWRAGDLRSPWWTFNPSQARYMEQSMPVFVPSAMEWYVHAGGRLRIVAYNALMQGQFRDSVVTVSSDDVERVVGEYWGGAALAFAGHYRLDIYFRGNTPEFDGPNRRYMNWAGLAFSYAW